MGHRALRFIAATTARVAIAPGSANSDVTQKIVPAVNRTRLTSHSTIRTGLGHDANELFERQLELQVPLMLCLIFNLAIAGLRGTDGASVQYSVVKTSCYHHTAAWVIALTSESEVSIALAL